MSKFLSKIVNDDCLKELKNSKQFFDLIFADPPYNLQIGEKLTLVQTQVKLMALLINGINSIALNIMINFVNLGFQNAKGF